MVYSRRVAGLRDVQPRHITKLECAIGRDDGGRRGGAGVGSKLGAARGPLVDRAEVVARVAAGVMPWRRDEHPRHEQQHIAGSPEGTGDCLGGVENAIVGEGLRRADRCGERAALANRLAHIAWCAGRGGICRVKLRAVKADRINNGGPTAAVERVNRGRIATLGKVQRCDGQGLPRGKCLDLHAAGPAHALGVVGWVAASERECGEQSPGKQVTLCARVRFGFGQSGHAPKCRGKKRQTRPAACGLGEGAAGTLQARFVVKLVLRFHLGRRETFRSARETSALLLGVHSYGL